MSPTYSKRDGMVFDVMNRHRKKYDRFFESGYPEYLDMNGVFAIISSWADETRGEFQLQEAADLWSDYVAWEDSMEKWHQPRPAAKDYHEIRAQLLLRQPHIPKFASPEVTFAVWMLRDGVDDGAIIDPDYRIEDRFSLEWRVYEEECGFWFEAKSSKKWFRRYVKPMPIPVVAVPEDMNLIFREDCNGTASTKAEEEAEEVIETDCEEEDVEEHNAEEHDVELQGVEEQDTEEHDGEEHNVEEQDGEEEETCAEDEEHDPRDQDEGCKEEIECSEAEDDVSEYEDQDLSEDEDHVSEASEVSDMTVCDDETSQSLDEEPVETTASMQLKELEREFQAALEHAGEKLLAKMKDRAANILRDQQIGHLKQMNSALCREITDMNTEIQKLRQSVPGLAVQRAQVKAKGVLNRVVGADSRVTKRKPRA